MLASLIVRGCVAYQGWACHIRALHIQALLLYPAIDQEQKDVRSGDTAPLNRCVTSKSHREDAYLLQSESAANKPLSHASPYMAYILLTFLVFFSLDI